MKSYRNFDIELLAYRRDGDREFLRSRVLASPVGGESHAQATESEFQPWLRRRLEELDGRQLDVESLIQTGENLASLLLPGAPTSDASASEPARSRLHRSLARLSEGEGLRIRIYADSSELAQLPWEYVYVTPVDVPDARKGPDGFLALNRRISIVRFDTRLPPAAIQPVRRRELRVLALLAETAAPGAQPLDLDRDELNLKAALEDIAEIDSRVLRPGTLGQLEQALARGAQVFHFSGHGDLLRAEGDASEEAEGSEEIEGRLILAGDGDSPGPRPFTAGKLASNLLGSDVRLAVLAACESAAGDPTRPWAGVASSLVRAGIPAVVGMQHRVLDASAIAFARLFYGALARGKTIDEAMTDGRLAIFNRGGAAERDWGTPVLHLRTDESHLFPPPPGPQRRNVALLMVSALLLPLWFFLHPYPWLEATLSRLMLGAGLGGATVVGLFAGYKFVAWLVSSLTGTDTGEILQGRLRSPSAAWLLAPLAGVALLLFGATSSVYLVLEEGHDLERVEVRLETGDGQSYEPQPGLEATRERPRDGEPLWFNYPAEEIAVEVVAPEEWELEAGSVLPRPWRRVELVFPRDFKRRQVRIVRLAPRSLLLSKLPEICPEDPRDLGVPCAEGEEGCREPVLLEVRVGSAEPVVRRLCQTLVYLGASEEVLEALESEEDPEDRAAALEPCVFPAQGTAREDLLRRWRGSELFIPTRELLAGEELHLAIRWGYQETPPTMSKSFDELFDSLDTGIKTLCFQ